jgi:hypothetical protein
MPLGLVLLVLRQPGRTLPDRPPPPGFVEQLVLRLAAQDWLLGAYLVTLLFEVLVGHGPRRPMAIALLTIDLVGFGLVVWLVRGVRLRGNVLPGFLYRMGILGVLLGTFFELQWILPSASGPSLDAELHRLDLRLFGVEPAQAFDRFVTPSTTEWFSFFYYGYFLILAAHIFPVAFAGRSEKLLTRFGFGVLWLYCVGHVVYTIVPAYGPYAHLSFEHPLTGKVWWPLVERTVASVDGSARTDVFPSLHTAGPAFLALFSFEHRRRAPFRYTWLPLSFAATQIILATMFLRWHYLVDIIAGLALAASGIFVGRLALHWDTARTRAGGLPAWPPLDFISKDFRSASPSLRSSER